MSSSFEFPQIHDFPPFFTKQINLETANKQLQLWSDIVLGYTRAKKIHTLNLNEALNTELFNNSKLKRKVELSFAQEIIQKLVSQGNAEWEGKEKARCLIIWRTPDEWADLIYKWVFDRGLTDTVFTVFELMHDDEYADAAFHQLDPAIMMKALQALERRGKAQVFQGSDPNEDGVKFFT